MTIQTTGHRSGQKFLAIRLSNATSARLLRIQQDYEVSACRWYESF